MNQQKYEMIIKKCLRQNRDFKQWRLKKIYRQFHHHHYDWWAFPINAPSSHGDKYQIRLEDKQYFINNHEFINALRQNAIMVCEAWGFNLQTGQEISNPKSDQKWQNWPIRLYKMAVSLQLFDQIQLHKNAIIFGMKLINKKYKFYYNKDLSYHFIQYANIYNLNTQQKTFTQSKKFQINHNSLMSNVKIPQQRYKSQFKASNYPKLTNIQYQQKCTNGVNKPLNKYSKI